MRYRGSLVALITPMKDGGVDLAAVRELVEWQLAEGTDGIVPCGSTGEGMTLTDRETHDVIRTVVEVVRGRVPVIAGAGSNSTQSCIEGVRRAKEAKADGVLVVTPYYNKPGQEGLLRHYRAVWEATRFPVIAYNVPSRTCCDLLPDTVARLAREGVIVGLKDSTASMERQLQVVEKIGEIPFTLLSGDDFTVWPYISCGGHGAISVTTNVVPRMMKELLDASLRGDRAVALRKQVALAELNRSLFVETNPGPVKAAVSLLGKAANELRLPLAPVSDESLAKIREAMVRLELVR